MPTRRFARRLAVDQSGAAILEFVLVLPLFLALVAGTFEIGRMLLTRLVVERAVQSGARYLARVEDPGCVPSCSAGAEHAVAMAHDVIAAGVRVAPGLVRVTARGQASDAVVSLTAEVDLALDLLATFGLPVRWTVSASHEERRVVE